MKRDAVCLSWCVCVCDMKRRRSDIDDVRRKKTSGREININNRGILISFLSNRACCYWNRWRPSRQKSLASAAGTTGSSCADGRFGSSRLMAWTRLTPPMFSHFLVRPRRRRRSLPTTTVSLLAIVMMIGKFIPSEIVSSCCLLKK